VKLHRIKGGIHASSDPNHLFHNSLYLYSSGRIIEHGIVGSSSARPLSLILIIVVVRKHSTRAFNRPATFPDSFCRARAPMVVTHKKMVNSKSSLIKSSVVMTFSSNSSGGSCRIAVDHILTRKFNRKNCSQN
jgi:hypothetical protein